MLGIVERFKSSIRFSVGKETANNFKKEKAFCSAAFKLVYRKKVRFQEVEYQTEHLASFGILSHGMFEDLDSFRNYGLLCFHDVNNIICL